MVDELIHGVDELINGATLGEGLLSGAVAVVGAWTVVAWVGKKVAQYIVKKGS